MGWRDLLQKDDERIVVAWVGGRSLCSLDRRWKIEGALPPEHGWYEWRIKSRTAELVGTATNIDGFSIGDLTYGRSPHRSVGYLVGDLFVSDQDGGKIKNPDALMKRFERVHLIEDGIEHFARVSVARFWDEGPYVFVREEFPLGPEDEVIAAYLDRLSTLDNIQGVVPALDLAWRMKVWHRSEVERRRAEEAARREVARREAEAARLRDEKMAKVRETLGDGEIRRQLALEDFEAAARAALTVGGGEYIEHRRGRRRDEFIVRYRVDGRRYECVCDQTMHIVDAGICLQDHDTGEKGDTYFTLESMPGVTRAAMAEGAAIWRHV